jgi:hypothetical protein
LAFAFALVGFLSVILAMIRELLAPGARGIKAGPAAFTVGRIEAVGSAGQNGMSSSSPSGCEAAGGHGEAAGARPAPFAKPPALRDGDDSRGAGT